MGLFRSKTSRQAEQQAEATKLDDKERDSLNRRIEAARDAKRDTYRRFGAGVPDDQVSHSARVERDAVDGKLDDLLAERKKRFGY